MAPSLPRAVQAWRPGARPASAGAAGSGGAGGGGPGARAASLAAREASLGLPPRPGSATRSAAERAAGDVLGARARGLRSPGILCLGLRWPVLGAQAALRLCIALQAAARAAKRPGRGLCNARVSALLCKSAGGCC